MANEVQRIKAKWVKCEAERKGEGNFWYCSNCHNIILDGDLVYPEDLYCPCCNAYMKDN